MIDTPRDRSTVTPLARRSAVATSLLAAALTLSACAGLASPGGTPAPTASPAAVKVVAVATADGATTLSAGGYVQDVIETGGTCTFTLTQAGTTVAGTSAAEPDATTTWCANVSLTLPHPGQPWSLDVQYASPASAGSGSLTSTGAIS